MNVEESIKVVVRVRPMLAHEPNYQNIIKVNDDFTSLNLSDISDSKKAKTFKVNGNYDQDIPKTFAFSKVYDESVLTEKIFEETCTNFISSSLEGYNCTVLSYGATGSGKTHTMFDNGEINSKGIMQQTFCKLFERIQNTENNSYRVEISFFQIYMDKITDLLTGNANKALDFMGSGKKEKIVGLTSEKCICVEDCFKWFEIGKKNRIQRETKMNVASSRSHAVLRISVKDFQDTKSNVFTEGVLNLVDLAGSERLGKSEVKGKSKDETIQINLSLLTLGNVIFALSTHKSFVPYRSSQLTRYLKNSLGGNSKCVFIANVSPSSFTYNETLNTLRYACRAKQITNKPIINEDIKDRLIKKLNKDIISLENESKNLKKLLEELFSDNTDEVDENENDEFIDMDQDIQLVLKIEDEEKKKRILKKILKQRILRIKKNEDLKKEIKYNENNKISENNDNSDEENEDEDHMPDKETFDDLNDLAYGEFEAKILESKFETSKMNESELIKMIDDMQKMVLRQNARILQFKAQLDDILKQQTEEADFLNTIKRKRKKPRNKEVKNLDDKTGQTNFSISKTCVVL